MNEPVHQGIIAHANGPNCFYKTNSAFCSSGATNNFLAHSHCKLTSPSVQNLTVDSNQANQEKHVPPVQTGIILVSNFFIFSNTENSHNC